MGHSAIYMAANLLQRGLAFLLIPLYAAYFSTAEFGAMDLLFQMALILSLVTSLALPQGLVRGFNFSGSSAPSSSSEHSPLNEAERRAMLGALVTLLLPLALASTAAIVLFAEPISRAMFGGDSHPDWVRLTAILYIAMLFQQLPLQLHRTEQRSAQYGIWSLATFLLIAGGNLYFIVHLHLGLPGMLLGNVLGIGGTALPMLILMAPRIRFNFEWKRLAPLFAFGLPILPNLLSRKAMEVASRYMLPHWHGMAETGLYSMATRISSVLEVLFLIPFLSAWHPFLYGQAGRPETPVILSRICHYFLTLLVSALLILQAFRDSILGFLGRGKFNEAGAAASWLAVATVFVGLQYCVSSGFHLKKKLGWEMGLMAGAACLNLLFNFLLIPKYGAAGAAASLALAYALFFGASLLLSQKLYPIPYAWTRHLSVLIPGIVAFLAMGAFSSPSAKACWLVAFLLVGPGYDLWRHDELKATADLLFGKARGILAIAGSKKG